MTDHQVVIAGGGPTGMMLAAELSLAGVDAVIVERRLTQELEGSRAGGLHARTIEVLDMRGVAERFLAEGQIMQTNGFAYVPLDISDFPTRHPYGLALWQSRFEQILGGWVEELGVTTRRGRAVVGFDQDDAGVDVELDDGSTLRGSFLVGCDGGRSLVRKLAGIAFPGLDPSVSFLQAEVAFADEPPVGVRPEGGGIGPKDRVNGGNPYGVVLKEPSVEQDREPTLDDLRELLIALYGTDFRVHSPSWITRFTDVSRQAATYRAGRVLLAGDAAHIHSPHGGQGMNLGVQDAVNLGWKLAQVVDGSANDTLLDTYHLERHPVATRVLRLTESQVALAVADERHQSLHGFVRELLGTDDARHHVAGMMSALDIHYDLGEGHPLLGRRLPDLDLATADGPTRVFELLHDARGVVLNFGEPGGADLSAWAERVRVVETTTDGPWELPVIGEVEPPPAVLVRPDGHVAWTGAVTDPSLVEALTAWFGAGARA